jgi:ribosomal protein L37E
VRDYADIGAGAALALAVFLALGLILHWFFFVCALPAFGIFVFTEWATARQQARTPGYRYNFDEDGNIVAIQCENCGRASHNQRDIESKYCSFCGRYHKRHDNLKKSPGTFHNDRIARDDQR